MVIHFVNLTVLFILMLLRSVFPINAPFLSIGHVATFENSGEKTYLYLRDFCLTIAYHRLIKGPLLLPNYLSFNYYSCSIPENL